MQIIGWVRIINTGMTTLQASIGALVLPAPWNVLAPLIVGLAVQMLAEAINQLSASLVKQETPTQVLTVEADTPGTNTPPTRP